MGGVGQRDLTHRPLRECRRRPRYASPYSTPRAPPYPHPRAVTLGPLDIRTFMCTTEPQSPTAAGEGPVPAAPWVLGAGSA